MDKLVHLYMITLKGSHKRVGSTIVIDCGVLDMYSIMVCI